MARSFLVAQRRISLVVGDETESLEERDLVPVLTERPDPSGPELCDRDTAQRDLPAGTFDDELVVEYEWPTVLRRHGPLGVGLVTDHVDGLHRHVDVGERTGALLQLHRELLARRHAD